MTWKTIFTLDISRHEHQSFSSYHAYKAFWLSRQKKIKFNRFELYFTLFAMYSINQLKFFEKVYCIIDWALINDNFYFVFCYSPIWWIVNSCDYWTKFLWKNSKFRIKMHIVDKIDQFRFQCDMMRIYAHKSFLHNNFTAAFIDQFHQWIDHFRKMKCFKLTLNA